MSLEVAAGVFAAGLAAGALGGFLGLGGGVIMMPVLRFGLGLSPVLAAGTCVTAVAFTTMGGSIRHHRMGNVDLRSAFPIILAGLVSVAVLSWLFPLLKDPGRGRWLDLGTGIIFTAVSARMIWEGLRGAPEAARPRESLPGAAWMKGAIGAGTGVLPGLFGIGTGALLVPAFVLVLRAPMKTAIGTSLACFFAFALLSAVFKAAQGFVDFGSALPLCLGALLGSSAGAWMTKRFRGEVLKAVFGFVFLVVSMKYILTALGGKV